MCDINADGVWEGWFRLETCCGILVNSVGIIKYVGVGIFINK